MKKMKFYEVEQLRDVRALVRRAGALFGWRTAYRQLNKKRDIEDYTYRQLENEMDALGTALCDLGLKGKHIAVLGVNCYQWVLSYVSVICGVGVVVPMDKELSADDLTKLIIKSDVSAIILSKEYLKTVEKMLPSCPELKTCIVMDEAGDPIPEGWYTIPRLVQYGMKLLSQGERCFIDAHIDDQCLSEILFTSGTTGANKGVMLSHHNIMTVVHSAMCLINPGQISFSVLPINHTYECSCHILGGMYAGITICFNDSLKRVLQNIRRFQPEFTIMVPMFLESIMRQIWNEARKTHMEPHLKYGVWYSNLIRKIGIDARRQFFAPILENLGGNLNQIVCGGAPLSAQLVRQFDDLGIHVVNGYGITECAPLVAANSSHYKRYGSVGHVIPGCKVRIDSPDANGIGEIQVLGDNVMLGYYNDPESTKATFTEDGWFKTGDLGSLDRDGFLYLNGREKNLIILPNGKNICPEEIEEHVAQQLSYVKEVLVYASRSSNGEQNQLCAACYLDDQWMPDEDAETRLACLRSDIHKLNRTLAGYKRIADVCITDSEFEKTTTKKVKRHIAERRFVHV